MIWLVNKLALLEVLENLLGQVDKMLTVVVGTHCFCIPCSAFPLPAQPLTVTCFILCFCISWRIPSRCFHRWWRKCCMLTCVISPCCFSAVMQARPFWYQNAGCNLLLELRSALSWGNGGTIHLDYFRFISGALACSFSSSILFPLQQELRSFAQILGFT